jgi:hypothetical protein
VVWDCRQVFVLDIRARWRRRRIDVWPEIFWMDSTTLRQVRGKLWDSPVEKAGEVDQVVLWKFDEKVEIAPRGEQ